MSLQACSNVALEDVALLDECCPSGRDSSLNLLVLVSVSGAVSLFQVDVTFNVLDLSVVDIYWCVFSIITFVFKLFIVSVFMWSLPVAVPFFISLRAVSTFLSRISFGLVWIIVLCSLSVKNSSIHWNE